MTERLYYRDAYLDHFTARVTTLSEDGLHVTLDRTAFYPTSGGQAHDVGFIQGVAVESVHDEGERVVHVVANPLPRGGDVECTIDWTRRHDLMQQHTGQHLLSALFADTYGFQTVSVHMGLDTSTLDLNTDSLSAEALHDVERLANVCVAQNHPIVVQFEDAARAKGLRKATDRDGEIRVVEIHSLDRSACGGTHVRSTAEIGSILLRRTEKTKGNTRVEFVCGARALDRCRRDFKVLSRVATRLSAAMDDVPALVDAHLDLLRSAESERKQLQEALDAYRAKERYESTRADEHGIRAYVEVQPAGGLRADTFKGFALAFTSLPRSVYIVSAESPPSVLVASSADSDFDAGRRLRDVLAQVGGRGGGSPRLAQGSVPEVSLLSRVVQLLLDHT